MKPHTPGFTPYSLAVRAILPLLVTLLGACGGDDAVGPDPELQALVGDWDATELILAATVNPDLNVDLIQEGATFDLNIQPSGQYTAILVYAGQDQTEIGQVEVDGNRLTLTPTVPADQPETTGTYSLQGNVLTLDGSTEFDFNFDGTPDPATVHFELVRE